MENIDGVSLEETYLYLITEDRLFNELDDDETVENCKIKDGDNLYLLTYRWTQDEDDVLVLKTGSHIWGVEPGDTCLGIKLKVQDQTGIPPNDITLFNACGGYFEGNRRKTGLADKSRPFYVKDARLVAITEEEFQAEAKRIEEEWKRNRLEMLAASAGQSVKEYLAEQERQRKEAQLENERRIQKEKEEAGLEREKQIQKQKDDQARKQEEVRQKRMLGNAPNGEYRKPMAVDEYFPGKRRNRDQNALLYSNCTL